MIKIKSMCVALNLFCFGHFFPIPKISTPAKVIVAAIHSARATAAKLEIMDGFAFDDISTFFASDCVSDNSRHTYLLRKALLLYFIVSRSFGKHCIFIRRCCSSPTWFILAVSEQILKVALPSLFHRKCYELHSKIIPYVGFRELFYWLWHSGRQRCNLGGNRRIFCVILHNLHSCRTIVKWCFLKLVPCIQNILF